ncbi:MAG: TatD family hydrolase [Planctomycetota bacterium]|nr:TatD family hydrolase [Planctomycetota bacterium]
MIDTHCHLTFPDFGPDRFPGGVAGVLRDAAAAGVDGCITISTTHPDAVAARAIARLHPNVWCSAGVHPLYSDEGPHDWGVLREVARDEKCVAWGELGLDNHYETPPRDVQRQVLEEQLAFIAQCRREGIEKPIVLHCREAFADLIPMLRASGLDATRMVFHCFTGSPADMRLLLDFGASVSFTGVLTYRNAGEVREAAALVPAGRFMVETDAPFLSPEPRRTERPCRPSMCALTARRLAEVRGVSFEALHEEVNETTARFFGVRGASRAGWAGHASGGEGRGA